MKPIVKLRVSVALITAALVLPFASAAHAQSTLGGTWSVQSTSSDTANVQFGVRYDTDNEHSDWSRDVPLSALTGLTRDQLQAASSNVRFDVAREAGTLHCTGTAAHGSAGGTFSFSPSSSFSDALAARGISRPDDVQQLRLTMANATIAFIDMLRRNSSTITTTDDIIRVLNHGVDERYVTGLASLGYRNLGANDLVRLRDHGVTVEFVQGVQALGYRPTPEELIRLRDHGVTVGYISGLQALGYRPSAQDLVRLADHGVTVEFARHVHDRGYNATVEQLIRMRDAGIS
ncbi:MAG TPA: hypothetical protein VK702_03255 [Candidatus Acidoferrum sp.]|jgi:hypothetical protein|nr:hypothetical protein [Candidatus Acidoferrum sp.]